MDKEYSEIVNDIISDRFHLTIAKYIESLNIYNNSKIKLYDAQISAIKFLNKNWNEKEICINKSRQCGMTTLLTSFLVYKFNKEPGKYKLFINCFKLSNSVSIIDKFCSICKLNNIKVTVKSSTNIEVNGNTISTRIEKINNKDGKRLIIMHDEYAFIQKGKLDSLKNHFACIEDILHIYASTPNGNNHFKDKFDDENIPNFSISWKDVSRKYPEKFKKTQTLLLGNEDKFEESYNNKFI